MFWAGCVALGMSAAQLCYSSDASGEVKVMCSDVKIGALETCQERMARMNVRSSSTGTVIFPGYYCGSNDCAIHAVPGIKDPNDRK